jgi:hypothetical protein
MVLVITIQVSICCLTTHSLCSAGIIGFVFYKNGNSTVGIPVNGLLMEASVIGGRGRGFLCEGYRQDRSGQPHLCSDTRHVTLPQPCIHGAYG